jgi:hypothetical protein
LVGLVDGRQDGIARGSDMVAAEIPTQGVNRPSESAARNCTRDTLPAS